jgi:hypothetical protein
MPNTTDQNVFIKSFCSSGSSYVAAKRQYRQDFSNLVAPSKDTIYPIIKQFEESVCDKLAMGRKHSVSLRTDEFVITARGAIDRNSRRNVLRFSTTDCRLNQCCRDDLPFPYKIQPTQPLSDHRIARHYDFARAYGVLLEDSPRCLECNILLRLPLGRLHY